MKQWYDMTAAEIDPPAQRERAMAYQDVLMASELGRHVFADIIKMVEYDRSNTTSEFQQGLDVMLAMIKERCGLSDDFEAELQALLPVARLYAPEEEPKSDYGVTL